MSETKKSSVKIKKSYIMASVGAIMLASAGAVAGYTYAENQETVNVESDETANIERSVITIEEDADGEILINGKAYEPNGIAYSEGRIFMEKIPVNCAETSTALGVVMKKANIAANLDRDGRFEFELLNILAKDVCSYEEYRNLLAGGLSGFLYSSPGPESDAAQAGGEVSNDATGTEGVEAEVTDTTTGE